jgi:hypothetical protein
MGYSTTSRYYTIQINPNSKNSDETLNEEMKSNQIKFLFQLFLIIPLATGYHADLLSAREILLSL